MTVEFEIEQGARIVVTLLQVKGRLRVAINGGVAYQWSNQSPPQQPQVITIADPLPMKVDIIADDHDGVEYDVQFSLSVSVDDTENVLVTGYRLKDAAQRMEAVAYEFVAKESDDD